MKRKLGFVIAACATVSLLTAAEENVWTGASGDGLYFTDGNWLLGHTPGNQPSENVRISGEGVVVTYVPGGDFMPQGTVTIADGAKFIQEDGPAWPNLTNGKLVLEGGTYDTGSAGQFRLGNGQIMIKAGGLFDCKCTLERSGTGTIELFDEALIKLPNNFNLLASDRFSGGRCVIENELQPEDGAAFVGADMTCQVIALPDGAVVTAQAGHITMTEQRVDSIWAPGNAKIDFSLGSTATFTMPYPKEEIYAKIASKFTCNGEAISATDFADPSKWEVVANDENTATTFGFAASAHDLPAWGDVTATLADESVTAAIVQAILIQKGAAPVDAITVLYGTSEDNLDQQVEVTIPEDLSDGSTVTAQLENLTPNTVYTYQFTIRTGTAEEGQTISSRKGSFVTFRPAADMTVWVGGTSELASIGSNWLSGKAPVDGDKIQIVDVLAKNTKLVWDLSPVTLASWEQVSFNGGSIEVSFKTTPEAAVTITGDVHLGAGANWTHEGSAEGIEPTYALNVEIGGDLVVDEGAYIHAGIALKDNHKPYYPCGWNRGGPGFCSETFGTGDDRYTDYVTKGYAASFAGEGGYRTTLYAETAPAFETYGKILQPSGWGSSGLGNNDQFAGGGWVKLRVGGQLTLNGQIAADGFGYPTTPRAESGRQDSAGASSGGVIDLEVGKILGEGAIHANGGCDGANGNGSGGRIRVKLTQAEASFAEWTNRIRAVGGYLRNNTEQDQKAGVKDAGAGTIVLQTAKDKDVSGVIRIIGLSDYADITARINASGATHIPAMQDSDRSLSQAMLVVGAKTPVKFTRNFSVRVLVVGAQRVKNGTWTAAQVNALLGEGVALFSGDGNVTIGQGGLMIAIR